MKRLLTILAAVIFALAARAERRVVLATDKAVYIAGDAVLCSVWSLEDGALCDSSAVAYVELVSAEGLAATGKIALTGGRGAGAVILPASMPTGNYRIFAYTSDSSSAEASLISVFNTGSKARVKGGVEIVSGAHSEGVSPSFGGEISISAPLSAKEGAPLRIVLGNAGDSDVEVALSVTEDDGVPSPSGTVSIALDPGEPEPDGETIHARLNGQDAAEVAEKSWFTAFISAPGSASDSYTGKISPDGSIYFKTNNIYGQRDLVCEIMGLPDSRDCSFAPVSPFKEPDAGPVPVLGLSPSVRPALEARKAALRENCARLDTLYEFLPRRDNLLLDERDAITYHLDDYTRFPKVKDIIVEIIPSLAVRKHNGRQEIKIILEDVPYKGRSNNVLVMLDGVPVGNHEHMLSFDASLLGDVQVYPYNYALGKTVFAGIVNFVTTRHDMSSLFFDKNVRIVDFQGCSYPVSLGPEQPANAGATLLWQPLLRIPAGGSVSFELSASGQPLVITASTASAVSRAVVQVRK